MHGKPARQQDELDGHRRHDAPRPGAEQGELDAGEDVDRRRPARRMDCRPRARHVRRVDIVADHLERIIGLHARRGIERAAVEQRPAAMRALDTAEIDADLRLDHRVARLAQIMFQQHEFGGNRRVGLEFEHPVTVALLRPRQRGGGAVGAGIDGGEWVGKSCDFGHGRALNAIPSVSKYPFALTLSKGCLSFPRSEKKGSASTGSAQTGGEHQIEANLAALTPDRIAPSIVAGSPVCVQSPARNRLRQRVAVPGRRAS